MKIVTAFVFTITIAFILLVSFAYSGFYDVSARSPQQKRLAAKRKRAESEDPTQFF